MLLEVKALEGGYGTKQVLHGIDLTVGDGEIVAVLGHNAAGKSTMMKAIYGLLPDIRGSIRFLGQDIVRRRPSENVRAGMGYAPQGAEVFKSLSVWENLLLGGFAIADQRKVERAVKQVLEVFPSLAARASVRAGSLSGGERQMLALGRVLVTAPDLVMLDEPSGGLAPSVVDDVYGAIRRIVDEFGTSVLLVEQDAAYALEAADRVYVLANGRVTFQGAAVSVSADELYRLIAGFRQPSNHSSAIL